MPPKKAMKKQNASLGKGATSKALEKAPSKKKPLGKGKSKAALGKAARAKALGKVKKGNLKAKTDKNALNRKNLEKLGNMSLREKVTACAEMAEDEEEAAKMLKDNLTSGESGSLWAKHQSHLKRNPLEKEEYEKGGKKEKGLAAALWLVKSECKKFLHTSSTVAADEALKKADKWESELQMLKKFFPEELELHMQSGRVSWRDDPVTWGVFNYKDNHDWTTESSWKRGKKWQLGQEYDPSNEDLDKFKELYDKDAFSLGRDAVATHSGKGSAKGFGKSPSKGKAKGLGKGKGKAKGQSQLAIKDRDDEDVDEDEKDDKEPSEEDKVKEALKKGRKARDELAKAKANLEEALEKAKSSLNNKGKANAEGWKVELGKLRKKVVDTLHKGSASSVAWQRILGEAAKLLKNAKDETKELNHIGNKAGSTTSKKSKR